MSSSEKPNKKKQLKKKSLHQMKKKLAMTDSFIEILLDEVGDIIYYQDSNLLYRYFNEAYLELISKREDEVKDHDIFNVLPKDDAEFYHKDDLAVLKSGLRRSYEITVEMPTGVKRMIQIIKRPHIVKSGEVIGIIGIIKDITDIRENQRFNAMIDQVKNVFLEINRNILNHKSKRDFFDDIQMEIQSVFVQCAQSSVLEIDEKEEFTILVNRGYDENEADNFHMPLKDSFFYKQKNGDINGAFFVNNIQSYIGEKDVPIVKSEKGNQIESSLCIPLFIDDQLKYIISIDSFIKEAFNKTDCLVADFISKELPIIYRIVELHRETLKLSNYDGLTDLLNRRSFNEVTDNIIEKQSIISNFTIVIIDIDQLKKINDRYGHLAGDKYITEFVKGIKGIQNDRIKFGRIGGDEFVGYFEGYSYEAVEKMMEQLQADFSVKAIHTLENSFYGSFSYGLAYIGIDGEDRTSLMKVADLRMYKNKHQSR